MTNTFSKMGFYRCIPNTITFLRFLLAFLVYFLITHGFFNSAFCCFIIAGISDGIDGYLARKWNVTSRFGSIFDPIADKTLMFIGFVTLGLIHKLPLWLVILVISRDVLIILGGFFTFLFKLPIKLLPLGSSKLNTFFQITLIGVALITQIDDSVVIVSEFIQIRIIEMLIFVTTLTTVWSGSEYGFYFLNHLYCLYARAKDDSK